MPDEIAEERVHVPPNHAIHRTPRAKAAARSPRCRAYAGQISHADYLSAIRLAINRPYLQFFDLFIAQHLLLLCGSAISNAWSHLERPLCISHLPLPAWKYLPAGES
jgi:hypothetical protein